MPHTPFTKEFQDEAVRLALTSGRSRRAIAADLGVVLSTLRHWLDRGREREIDDPPEERQEDMRGGEAAAARERDLAPGTGDPEEGHGFFAKEGSR